MDAQDKQGKRNTTNIVLEPPTFSPPPDMRKDYLNRRKAALDALFDHAGHSEWKPVLTEANHVRGTGLMYGFDNIGKSAEKLSRAIQNGDLKCRELLDAYALAVNESYV